MYEEIERERKNYYNKKNNQKIDSTSLITKIKNNIQSINQIKTRLSSTSTFTMSKNSASLTYKIDNNEAINNNNNSRQTNATLVERVYLSNKFYPDSSKNILKLSNVKFFSNAYFHHFTDMFITLISSIVVLIAFVNIVVLTILCRYRKT